MRWRIGHFKSASETGNWGETVAVAYLRKHRCKIIDRNVKPYGRLELDIIAYDPKAKAYLFVEVKTRTKADEDHRPRMAVTLIKRRNMRKAAMAWMKKTGVQAELPLYRFDIIEVVGSKDAVAAPEVNWIRGMDMSATVPLGAYW